MKNTLTVAQLRALIADVPPSYTVSVGGCLAATVLQNDEDGYIGIDDAGADDLDLDPVTHVLWDCTATPMDAHQWAALCMPHFEYPIQDALAKLVAAAGGVRPETRLTPSKWEQCWVHALQQGFSKLSKTGGAC